LRTSIVQLAEEDARLLEGLLREQAQGGKAYPVDAADFRKLATHRVRRVDKDVTVTVPEDGEDEEGGTTPAQAEVRESIQIQSLLAEIGARMGMQAWLPRADRNAVVAEWKGDHSPPLDRLPLNYDETTLKTIERIDVLSIPGFFAERRSSRSSGVPCFPCWSEGLSQRAARTCHTTASASWPSSRTWRTSRRVFSTITRKELTSERVV
jgi:hypothetical protein